MNSIDLLVMGIKNLFRRKLRTFLTALGIVIGTISIVVMLSLGIAMRTNMEAQIAQMGDVTVLTVRPSYGGGGMVVMGGTSSNDGKTKLIDEDVEILKSIGNVEAVSPYLSLRNYTITSGRYELGYADIQGIDMSVADKFGLELSEGRLGLPEDRNAVVFGSEVIYEFFKADQRNYNYNYEDRKVNVDVLNDRLMLEYQSYGENEPSIAPVKLKGVGILAESGNWENAYSIYMDIDTVKEINETTQRRLGTYKRDEFGYDQIKVKVDGNDNVEAVQQEIEALGYQVFGMMDYAKEMEKMMGTVQLIVAGIGAISLIVAAIGITNTMVMAIYERRREIGIMKVIGAQIKDIKKLFLLEAAGIGVVGGIIGLGLSYLSSFLLNKYIAPAFGGGMGMGGEAIKMSIIPLWLSLGTVFFTAMIGLLSGYLPARKAMKLSALEAIKNE